MSRSRFIFYVTSAAAIVLVFWRIEELRGIGNIFLNSNLYYLPIIIVIQFVSYWTLALNYKEILMIKGLKLATRELFPITYVVQFISQALPTAGLSGQIFFIAYLKKFGLGLAEGIGRVILELATLYIAYAAYFITASILIFNTGITRSEPRIIYFIFAFLVFLLLCGMIFILSQGRREKSWARKILVRVLGDNAQYLTIVIDQFKSTLNFGFLQANAWRFGLGILWQMATLFTHVLTLFAVSHAIGSPMPFVACFVAFTFSKFLSMVSVIPGAPGIFETAMTLILVAFGIPAAPALTATILTRAFTFWLPMPIGWMLYHHYTKKWASAEME